MLPLAQVTLEPALSEHLDRAQALKTSRGDRGLMCRRPVRPHSVGQKQKKKKEKKQTADVISREHFRFAQTV